MQASQVERDAGLALLHRPANTKSILHYNTISRCHIDGEWPSIILSFSDGTDLELCPLFFAYEDREQIILLLVETIKRLSVATTGSDEPKKKLLENLFALMSDFVSKNLKIEDRISESLGSTYKPIHFSTSHTQWKSWILATRRFCPSFDTKVKQRTVLESINPRLKSFFRGKKTTVEAGIESLAKLVTHRHSGNTTSQANAFDHICEHQGVVKRLFYTNKNVLPSLENLLHSYLKPNRS